MDELTNLEEMIIEHPFFEGMSMDYLPLLMETASFYEVGADHLIFQQGEHAEHFFLVQCGHVALESRVAGRGIVKIQTIGDDDALGWSWLFPPYLWHFSARAATPTEMIAFYAPLLRQRAKEHSDFGYELIMRVAGVMLQRLQSTRLQILELASHQQPDAQ